MITTKPIDIEDAHADILQNALKKQIELEEKLKVQLQKIENLSQQKEK